LCVAILSFAVATLGAVRYFSPDVDVTTLGLALVLLAVGAIFFVGRAAQV
jgi:hypothetical protein